MKKRIISILARVAATAVVCTGFAANAAPPVIRKPAQPAKFLESVGRRAMILGREDGTFEAWINPVKVLRDFQLSVYFDGALEPVPLGPLADRVEVRPGRSTIVHSHGAFTVRQTWVAAIDRPVAAVLLDVDADRPLRLRATFLPEMKPMWPASFGGQSSYYDEKEHAFVMGEGLRRWAAVVGSPAFGRSSEQIGHQMPDRTVMVEMEITPERARAGSIPIVIAASNAGGQKARELYRAELERAAALPSEADRYYEEFDGRTMHVETPEPVLNGAFEQARFAMEKGWQCDEGVGCGLVAGYAPSGTSERPGFAWFFGGDAFMNSWSIVDYGDFERARGVLAFFRDHQRADGKLPHELTQSLALLDWSQYPYGYYHGDTTGLFLHSVAYYARRSGDLAFVRESWPALERAYASLLTAVEPDGLLSNRKAGAAATETGALAGKVHKDVYLQGVWLAALRGYADLADRMGKPEAGKDARERYGKAKAALESWMLKDKPWLPFATLTDGTVYAAQSAWQGFPLAYSGLDGGLARKAAAALNRPELLTPWGFRLFATDSPFYDPLSYNDGSVWPFVSGFALMAQFRNGQARSAVENLFGVAAMTGLQGAGFLPEYMSGERAQALPRSVPHQLFSSSAVVHPLVSGLLGLEGDAFAQSLTITPRVPPEWGKTAWTNYRVGASSVDGEIANTGELVTVRLQVTGPPLSVHIRPEEGSADARNLTCTSCARLEGSFRRPPGQLAPLRLRAPIPGENPKRPSLE